MSETPTVNVQVTREVRRLLDSGQCRAHAVLSEFRDGSMFAIHVCSENAQPLPGTWHFIRDEEMAAFQAWREGNQ